jgi:hypothetical protein
MNRGATALRTAKLAALYHTIYLAIIIPEMPTLKLVVLA